MVQNADAKGIPHYSEGTAAAEGYMRGARAGRGSAGFTSNADGGPQIPAREPREGGDKEGGKQGNGGRTEEVRAGEGYAAAVSQNYQ